MTVRVLVGHVLDRLVELPDESVHCVVTSPPYYGLRDYGIEPQAWDGDPACSHAWQGESVRVENNNGLRGSTLTSGAGPEKRQAWHDGKSGTIERAFCLRCNAWRGSLGLEPTPALYIEHIVAVFREVRRVLRKDGTLWLNIGDSYSSGGTGGASPKSTLTGGGGRYRDGSKLEAMHEEAKARKPAPGCKPKDLLGIPWALAFALRDDGWYLRSEITWAKRAPMPESCTDRPTSATEKVFLMTKSPRYFYDAEAVKEEASEDTHSRGKGIGIKNASILGRDLGIKHNADYAAAINGQVSQRNMRNWWLLGPEPFPEAHFATFPTEIPRRAILAGTSERGVCPKCGAPWERVTKSEEIRLRPNSNSIRGHSPSAVRAKDGNPQRGAIASLVETIGWRPTCSCDAGAAITATVLDPFLGAGTTGLVADRLGRNCIGIELNPSYAEMGERRVRADAGMFAEICLTPETRVSNTP